MYLGYRAVFQNCEHSELAITNVDLDLVGLDLDATVDLDLDATVDLDLDLSS